MNQFISALNLFSINFQGDEVTYFTRKCIFPCWQLSYKLRHEHILLDVVNSRHPEFFHSMLTYIRLSSLNKSYRKINVTR